MDSSRKHVNYKKIIKHYFTISDSSLKTIINVYKHHLNYILYAHYNRPLNVTMLSIHIDKDVEEHYAFFDNLVA